MIDLFCFERARDRGDCAVMTRELFVSTAEEMYGLFGLAYIAAFFIPNFYGDAFTRPMLVPFFALSPGNPSNSFSWMVSEPTDFESRIILLTYGPFFYIRKLKTSFSSSVFGSATTAALC